MKLQTYKIPIWPYAHILYGSIAVVSIIMIVATVYLSGSTNPGDVSNFQHILIRLSMLLPIIVIWFIAARGAKHFKTYAVSVRGSKEGPAFNYIANGLLLLVAYIILLNVVGTVIALFNGSPQRVATAFANHVPLLVALLATASIFRGSQQLVRISDTRFWTLKRLLILIIPYTFVMLGFIYHFYQSVPIMTLNDGTPRFALPPEVLVLTYALPHTIIWLWGMITAVNLSRYAVAVPGVIFKSIFNDVKFGVILVFMCIFFAQLLITTSSLAQSFNFGFIFIYGVILLAVAGFHYIFRGARRLQLIEETT